MNVVTPDCAEELGVVGVDGSDTMSNGEAEITEEMRRIHSRMRMPLSVALLLLFAVFVVGLCVLMWGDEPSPFLLHIGALIYGLCGMIWYTHRYPEFLPHVRSFARVLVRRRGADSLSSVITETRAHVKQMSGLWMMASPAVEQVLCALFIYHPVAQRNGWTWGADWVLPLIVGVVMFVVSAFVTWYPMGEAALWHFQNAVLLELLSDFVQAARDGGRLSREEMLARHGELRRLQEIANATMGVPCVLVVLGSSLMTVFALDAFVNIPGGFPLRLNPYVGYCMLTAPLGMISLTQIVGKVSRQHETLRLALLDTLVRVTDVSGAGTERGWDNPGTLAVHLCENAPIVRWVGIPMVPSTIAKAGSIMAGLMLAVAQNTLAARRFRM